MRRLAQVQRRFERPRDDVLLPQPGVSLPDRAAFVAALVMITRGS